MLIPRSLDYKTRPEHAQNMFGLIFLNFDMAVEVKFAVFSIFYIRFLKRHRLPRKCGGTRISAKPSKAEVSRALV